MAATMPMVEIVESKFVVIGGGIAGVCCAEELCRLCPEDKVTLITASDVVKAVTNWRQMGKIVETFDVQEKHIHTWTQKASNLKIVKATVSALNAADHNVSTEEGQTICYEKLCICSGGRPNIIETENPHVLGIRDTSTVEHFSNRLAHAERVVVLGNGGIALELVYEMVGCEVIWAIKDDAIGNRFLDKGAASFFLPHLNSELTEDATHKLLQANIKRQKYVLEQQLKGATHEMQAKDSGYSEKETACGSALGPDWSSGLTLLGCKKQQKSRRMVHIEYNTKLKQIICADNLPSLSNVEATTSEKETENNSLTSLAKQWPVYVVLDNGKTYGCDFVVSATGVVPNVGPFKSEPGFDIAEDGGLKVDSNMRTTLPDVYAAGDVCTTTWSEQSPYWHQMRLWSQARQMGAFSARCMVSHLDNEEIPLDFCFELFGHVTKFFGYKVILLGKYNSQGLGDDYELLLRCTEGQEYVKVVLHSGKMFGAMLIGETDLEETFENLILNQMDLSSFGEALLDPNIDIEDYFD